MLIILGGILNLPIASQLAGLFKESTGVVVFM